MRKLLQACAVSVLSFVSNGANGANGAPPPGSDPNSKISQWYKGLTDDQGNGCCSEVDCRPVLAEMREEAWYVFIDKRIFGDDAPNDWRRVPASKVIDRSDNPTGHSVACWSKLNGFYCFTPMVGG